MLTERPSLGFNYTMQRRCNLYRSLSLSSFLRAGEGLQDYSKPNRASGCGKYIRVCIYKGNGKGRREKKREKNGEGFPFE